MPANHDPWGEPIPTSRLTFSLATLFRLLTAISVVLGWLSVVRFNPHVATSVLATISVALAFVAAHRQVGGLWTKGAVGCSFLCGVPFLGLYVAALFVILLPPPWVHDSAELVAALGGMCLVIVALPLVAAVAACLLRLWLHLAADAAERARHDAGADPLSPVAHDGDSPRRRGG